MSSFVNLAKRLSRQIPALHPSIIASVSIVLVFATSAWRHYDTYKTRSPFQQEVWIEWLSWIIIFLAQKVVAPAESTPSDIDSVPTKQFWSTKGAVWVAAFAAVTSQLLSSRRNLNWILPLTTIAITICRRVFSSRTNSEDGAEKLLSLSTWLDISAPTDPWTESAKVSTSVILNLIACALLASYKRILAPQSMLIDSILFLITRTVAFHGISSLGHHSDTSIDNSQQLAALQNPHQLAGPALLFLTGILVVVRPVIHMSSLGILFHAIAQAIWWSATITLLRMQLNNTAANMDTISLSTEMSLTATTISAAGSALSTLLVSATQTVVVLRPGITARRVVYGLFLVLMLQMWARQNASLPSVIVVGSFKNGHPIKQLVMSSRKQFEMLEAKQSKTLLQAVAEYERRYGRAPPLNFEKWFALAQENNFVLIDEFDTLMDSLEPFHGMHPNVLQQRVDKFYEKTPDQLVKMQVTDGKMSIGETMAEIGEALTNKEWLEIVPYNMTMTLNGFDEAMVSTSWEEIKKALDQAKDVERYSQDLIQSNVSPVLDVSGQSAWAATSQACSVYSPARQIECPTRKLTSPLQFIQNATLSKDVCQNCELITQEGFMMGPDTLHISHELVPVWSASKPSTFHDILYPSSYYIGARGTYDPTMDSSWENKDNSFYWVGTATGGRVTEQNWNMMQRQRLVLKTQPSNNEEIQLLEELKPGSNQWTPRFSTMSEVSDLFATRIARVVQCSEEACRLQKEAFGISDVPNTDPPDAAYRHKFVLDIDGNTFSGRFYRLLQSNSMVIKQTIFREWHDDRLMPWVHYVPLSTSYDELPEMARYLATTENGLELAERIAKESTEWHNKALRDVDLQLVWIRLLLEYGRLMNPEMTL